MNAASNDMENLKYSELLKLNKELGAALTSDPYKIAVLSNITVHQIKEITEYYLRRDDIKANVTIGDYDNIVQDSVKFADSNMVIIFWELCNIIDGLQYKTELYNSNQLDALVGKIKSEIDLVFKQLENTSLVLFNEFTSIAFSSTDTRKTNLKALADRLNRHIKIITPPNVHLLDIEKVIANIGIHNSFNFRNFYSSKALYTIEFFKFYSDYIKPYVRSANGKSKKAIIFDCDNTLWKGILGEDGFDAIEMSPKTKDGAIFHEIQSIALDLHNQGILLGLCSKNNPADVGEVIKSHPDMQLRDEHITINKTNWTDKVTNLSDIATELNIGLESLVFVDDSSFEANLVKEQLPEVTVLQVPEKLHEYPQILRRNLDLFFNLSFSSEDKQKAKMYKQQLHRKKAKKQFANIEDYLASLNLKVRVSVDNKNIIPRISQMSQKTNQFNLTTKRYTESDIRNYISDPLSKVFALSVSDKFGDSGITGLAIVIIDQESRQTAHIDTFLMSCRIIGRNVEYTFMDFLMKYLKNIEVNDITAKFIKSPKNDQVHDFFDKCSFCPSIYDGGIKKYNLNINNYKPKNLNYIEVIDE
jgi:FkbH-like protein